MIKKIAFAALMLVQIPALVFAQRNEILLEKNWKFTRDSVVDFMNPSFNDSRWQNVEVPHDWAIYGPFSMHNDKQNLAIVQDGQTEPQEHAGRTGGLPFVGVGFYRTEFTPPGYAPGKKVYIQFDGAMSNSEVYINGKKAGYWPNGYNTFFYDITDFVEPGKPNTLAVKLENFVESSRWYPGAGLYRNVHVIVTEKEHIPIWGTQVTTPEINAQFARIHVKTQVNGTQTGGAYRLVTTIEDEQGNVVASDSAALTNFNANGVQQDLNVVNPRLWGYRQPNLYTAVSRLYAGNTLKDTYRTRFGIRSIELRPDEGFFLNGEKLMFQGVCNHHDLGPLGAAVNEAALRRQVRIMLDMGVNAIRTSHNMPAPELVKICDEMGMMIMAESFDEWKQPKVPNGYNKYFDEWVEKDLVNLVRHYRNNPSVVMWCIGNEVPEQWNKDRGPKLTLKLQEICHREDPTRPVTNGMDAPDAVLNNMMAAVLDVPGFNYRPHRYRDAYAILPQRMILGSETGSTLSSRGIYKWPVQRKELTAPGMKYDDHQASSYDLEHCGWSNPPEDDWIQHEDLPYTLGEFIWTGFDYLGEPTPYYSDWPSHSSLFGAVDLAGIPKDRFYLYRSHWKKDENTLHVVPHWTHPGREGQVTPVFVYTNFPSAELFINGKSQGRVTKDTSITLFNSDSAIDKVNLTRQKRYRLMWMDTKYEPGTVKVVAYDGNGQPAMEKEIRTAGKPHRIVLTPDRETLDADGKDIVFVNVKVVDRNGVECPNETSEMEIRVKGAGKFKAIANGNPASLESFQTPRMKLFSGQLTALIQTSENPGTIHIEARSKGLRSASITVKSN